jgi:hypothetical protein
MARDPPASRQPAQGAKPPPRSARDRAAAPAVGPGAHEVTRARSSSVRDLDPAPRLRYPGSVNRLIEYLRQHVMIDFQGELTVAAVRDLLAGDDSRDAKVLLAKLVADKSVDQLFLVLADCLLEHVQRSLTDDVVREQIRMYAEA